jgi:uncharacterized membrane protein
MSADMIEQYLESLRGELAGEDPALVQDALYDAEEFLRDEVAGAEDPAAAYEAAVAAYGSPHEIAEAYREAEITVQRVMAPPAPQVRRSLIGRFFGVVADPRAWGALFYLVLAFATGIAYFTIAATGLSLSLGLIILIIGVPMILLFFGVVRGTSFLEGRIVEVLLGVRMPRRPRPFTPQGGIVERVKSWFTDWRTWTTILYMILQLPLGVIYFTALVTAVSLVGAGGIILPISQMFTGEPVIWVDDVGYLLHPAAVPFVVAAAVLGLVVIMHAVRGVGKLHGAYAKAMLVGDFTDGQ